MDADSAAETQKADRADAGDDMDMGGMHEETANKNKTFGERLVSWLGRLHTMVIHFPIAMFIGAFGLELFGVAQVRQVGSTLERCELGTRGQRGEQLLRGRVRGRGRGRRGRGRGRGRVGVSPFPYPYPGLG